MTKARDLANLIAAGNPLADGAISVAEISDLTASAAELNQLDNTADLPDIRPSLLLDFANSKTLDPRITFTRGSTATYWDGKTTAKAEENLLSFSQEFDHVYWQKTRTTVTANAVTAPDGSTTADYVEQATGQTTYGAVALNTAQFSADTYVLSVYAKQSEKPYVVLVETAADTSFNTTNFNLSTGAVGTTNAGHTATITDVGNGWYRCSIGFTVNAARSGAVAFYLADTDNSSTVTDSGGVYLWGAQLEQRSSATAYTPTTTSPIVKYQPVLQTAASGEARFDHDPVTGESKGLLIEEARTNLISYSEAFDNAAWVDTGMPITTNTVVAPDGTLTADKMVPNTGNNEHYIQDALTSATGVFTDSVYAKTDEVENYVLAIRPVHVGADQGATQQANFDLSNGTVTEAYGVTASIEDVGNGWYRCSVTYEVSGTITGSYGYRLQLYTAVAAVYAGDDYSGVYIWGAQREVGSFPTSYIPTSGSTVTRAVDIVRGAFSDVQAEGAFTVYADYSIPDSLDRANASVLNVVRSTGGSSDGYWRIRDGAYVGLQAFDVAGSLVVNETGLTTTLTRDVKIATTIANNDFSLYVNSDYFIGSDTSGIYAPRTYYHIGSSGVSEGLNGTIKKLAFYPKRLSNATLQAMTEE